MIPSYRFYNDASMGILLVSTQHFTESSTSGLLKQFIINKMKISRKYDTKLPCRT